MWLSSSRAYTAGSSSPAHPLIVNMGAFGYADPEQPFLNCFKQAGANANFSAWTTLDAANADTNEEAYLYQILTNGYPTTLTLPNPPVGGQKFTHLKTGCFVGMALASGASSRYLTGTYRLQWQGKCTFTVGGDATVISGSGSAGVTVTGNQVSTLNAVGTVNTVTINVAGTSTAGITFDFTSIPDNLNYFQLASLVPAVYASNYDAGQVFRPDFLAWLTTLKPAVLRFMDYLNTNAQVQHARYLGYAFLSAPSAGTPLPALAAAWPGQSGQRRITLATGEELLATFATGSTTVTSTANPTITASASTVPSGENTTDYCWFRYDSFSGRPQVADFCYTTYGGVPFEICVLLAKTIGADAWINVPASFQASDWASLCSLITSNLGPGQKCYVEFMNEVWNAGTFNIYHYCNFKSFKLWGSSQVGSFYGMTVAEIADQFATTAGSPAFDENFIVVMAGQAANTAWLTNELAAPAWTGNTPPWQRTSSSGQKTIKAVAIAPYLAGGPIYAADFTHMQAQADGGYSDFFATWTTNPVNGYTYHDSGGTALPAGGWFSVASTYVTNTITAMKSYGALPVYCYEGSWQWYDQNNGAGQESFLDTAAVDPRINSLQQQYFRTMKNAGVMMPCQYSLCSPYGGFQWGLFASPLQPLSPLSSSPPRFQGAVNYVLNG